MCASCLACFCYFCTDQGPTEETVLPTFRVNLSISITPMKKNPSGACSQANLTQEVLDETPFPSDFTLSNGQLKLTSIPCYKHWLTIVTMLVPII